LGGKEQLAKAMQCAGGTGIMLQSQAMLI